MIHGGPGRSRTVQDGPGCRTRCFKLFKTSVMMQDDPGYMAIRGRSVVGPGVLPEGPLVPP